MDIWRFFSGHTALNLLNVVALQSKELGSGGGIGSGQRSCLIL